MASNPTGTVTSVIFQEQLAEIERIMCEPLDHETRECLCELDLLQLQVLVRYLERAKVLFERTIAATIDFSKAVTQ